jgi:hypothetical protein
VPAISTFSTARLGAPQAVKARKDIRLLRAFFVNFRSIMLQHSGILLAAAVEVNDAAGRLMIH